MTYNKEYFYLKEKELLICDNGEIIDLKKVNKAQKKRILKETNYNEVGLIVDRVQIKEGLEVI